MKAHALDAWPAAACGGVFGRGGGAVYRPLDGVADAPRETFRIDAAAVREVDASLGAPAAIVIAHPSPEGAEGGKIDPLLFTPSAAEMRAQLDLALPFGVVVCDRAQAYRPFWFGDQCPIPPLLGRPFRHGVTDCFSVVRDWYRQGAADHVRGVPAGLELVDRGAEPVPDRVRAGRVPSDRGGGGAPGRRRAVPAAVQNAEPCGHAGGRRLDAPPSGVAQAVRFHESQPSRSARAVGASCDALAPVRRAARRTVTRIPAPLRPSRRRRSRRSPVMARFRPWTAAFP